MNSKFFKMEKRKRDNNIVEIGDEVRLVNLPAYPGLEGLTGRVVSVSDSVDVELHKTGAIKRVCHFIRLFNVFP